MNYRASLIAFILVLALCGTSWAGESLGLHVCTDCAPFQFNAHAATQATGFFSQGDADLAIAAGPPIEPGQPVPTQFEVRVWYCQKQQVVDLAELSVQITWGQCQGSNGLYMPGEYVNLSIGRYPVPPAGAWAYLTIGPHNNGGEVLVAQKRVNSIRCDVVPH
jgi:hypothetical protein